MTIEAAPIVVGPSGEFLGVDGAWSTFHISVGSPAQPLQVLAATEVSSTWVIAPEACGQKDAANCTEARGETYDRTKSSSWNEKDLYGLGDESILGYQGNDYVGTYGYDNIEIQGKGANASVDHQVIAAITAKKFYVGNLGLAPHAINFTSSEDSSPSLLTSLKNQNLIPSLSYGYTAGASYRGEKGALGSLTLGGYEASRLVPNDLSFNFAPTEKRQLMVGLQSITHSNSKTETSLLSDGVLALVDSTVPYLWLPQKACDAFVDAFGLSQPDQISNLYLVNETLHDSLIKENASVVFQLANGPSGGPSINITLPYASFDLLAIAPLVKSPTRYFPLQRANDDDAITLGRTFFQEAFLIVDYEHSNFSVSQAVFNPNAPSHVVPLASNSSTSGPTPSATSGNGAIFKTPQSSGSHGIGTGAIAGIAVAIILLLSLGGVFFLFKRRQRRRARKSIGDIIIEVESPEPKVAPERYDDSKHDFSKDPEVKKPAVATVTVNETQSPMTPPTEVDCGYFSTMNEKERVTSSAYELPGSPPNRSELSTPEPWQRELPSPDPETIRSELSTPEPSYNHAELPSPDPSHEMASSNPSPLSSGHPSPALHDNRGSALRSPAQLTFQHPSGGRIDSDEFDAGWTRDGMSRQFFHRRYGSNESLTLSHRPTSSRMGSSDSEGWIHTNRVDESPEPQQSATSVNTRRNMTHLDPSDSETGVPVPSSRSQISRPRPAAVYSSSSSESEGASPLPSPSRHIRAPSTPFYSSTSYRPGIRRAHHAEPRPYSCRTGSSDSDAWETKLESASTEEASRLSKFPSVRHSASVPEEGEDSLSEASEGSGKKD